MFSALNNVLRQYIENDLVEFAKEHPNIVISAKIRNSAHPEVVGEYCEPIFERLCSNSALVNGNVNSELLRNLSASEIEEKLSEMRSASGAPAKKFKNRTFTQTPSTQGNWNPFLFK